MPKRTSAGSANPLRVVIVTLDSHLAGAVERAREGLRKQTGEIELTLHAASQWDSEPESLERCIADIERGDIIIASMLFMEDHIRAVLPALQARRDSCMAMVGCISAGEVINLTRLGRLRMGGEDRGLMALLKRLRGSKKGNQAQSSGARQMAMLRRLPKVLRLIPGTAQDLRFYFLTMQYWLAGSEDNVTNMVRCLVDRYAGGAHEHLRGTLSVDAPVEYPEVGVYHPAMRNGISETLDDLPKTANAKGTVGLLLMRSYVLAGDTAHYDEVIRTFEARGLRVVPAFSSGLDARPAIESFFADGNKTTVDAIVSLVGFSLVGGPAYNDAAAAEEILAKTDVPYISAHAVEFQSLDQWQASERGLLPIEATMMISIPELEGATGPMVYGGRVGGEEGTAPKMQADPERATMLAARVEQLVTLRQTPRDTRRLAVVLFNFPPNAGSTGTAAHLSVFSSLFNLLRELKASGYEVDVPDDVDDLRNRVLQGNAERFGTDANVFHRISADDHVQREPFLADIEAQWGAAPGRHLSDGRDLFVLGERFGNVFVGVQPGFGYEGDPMRLLFEKSFAPTHAFAAFYRFLREDFAANAVLHFGTHGALEFMPGKQTGLSSACWPDRLIGDLPNYYLYAANNPSEGAIARRRSGATLVSYLTPPIAHAGLYRGFTELKDSLQRLRSLPPEASDERKRLLDLIVSQAQELDLEIPAHDNEATLIAALTNTLHELEATLIPHGLHVLGEVPAREERIELLTAMAEMRDAAVPAKTIEELVDGAAPEGDDEDSWAELASISKLLSENGELAALVHALDGGYVRPAPGGDLLRTPEVMPTGRNVHGFDPFRLPSAFGLLEGKRQADLLLARHAADGTPVPETVAMVLWGTDNIKSEGCPLAQALAMIGAEPRFDSYGRIAGARLIPLNELGRPRIDVVMTLSGIFRDLLPLQTRMLAEAAYLAAVADEPAEQNYVRKHALAYQAAHDCDIEAAAMRVFSNAYGAYGSNVNHLVDSGAWNDEDELADVYTKRKCFAYGRTGESERRPELLEEILGTVDLAYQNLESVELGVTTLDHYFDTLGGVGRAVRRARGESVPVYIGDQTAGPGTVRTLEEQIALETRTRALNPKWYEGMLRHGHEGVRQIEAHITNTVGWSATTGQVSPWVYQQLTETFVLDPEMRERLAALNPVASAKVAGRLLEAHERDYWSPDEATLEALRQAGEELEDRLEGIQAGVAA